MKIKGPSLILASFVFIAQGCSGASTAKKGDAAGAGTDTATDAGTGTGTASDATGNMTANNYPSGYYTGYDGTDQFALLVAGFGGNSTYSLTDPSIAKIESVSVTVPPATITAITQALKDGGITNSQVTKSLSRFGKARTLWKITPKKAGSTTLVQTTKGGRGGGGGGPPGSQSASTNGQFSNGSTTTNLAFYVANYTTDQFGKGKARYATAHDADNPACGDCHLHGKDNAPPHALGDVNRIPDVAAQQWVTTGVLGTRKAHIPHAWKFADADEELGTVAYVRSLEASDPEQLLLLEFAADVLDDGVTITVAADGTVTAAQTPGAATSTASSTGTGTGTAHN